MDYENKICYYMCVTRASTVNLFSLVMILRHAYVDIEWRRKNECKD